MAPRPRPSTAMSTASTHSGVTSSIRDSSATPTTDGDHAGDQVALPGPGAGDDPAGHHARDHQAADHEDRHQPGMGGAHAAGDLEVLAQVDRGTEHRDADHQGRAGRQRRRPVAEEAQRDDRLDGDARLDVDRGRDHGQAADDERPAHAGGPAELVAGQGDPDQQDADAAHQEGGAEVVDARLARPAYDGQVQRLLQQHERRHGDRDADVEAPAPAQAGGVDDEAADERPAERGGGEDGADVAAVATALARGDHARDHDLDEGGEAADAEALDRPGTDQDRPCWRRCRRSASRSRR